MKGSAEKIIKVATDLICKNGYHGTSMQMIANKVGITKSTIFHHFENKEAILLAILDIAYPKAMIRLTMLANDEDLSGTEKLKKFIALHMEMVANKGDVLSIYLREEGTLSAQHAKMQDEGRKQYARFLRKIIRQIQREGDSRFSGMSSTIVTNAILGICNWSVRWYKKDGSMNIEAVCQQLYQIIDPLS